VFCVDYLGLGGVLGSQKRDRYAGIAAMIAEFFIAFAGEVIVFSILAAAALIWLNLRLKRAEEDQSAPR
jgi:hypothetical protein